MARTVEAADEIVDVDEVGEVEAPEAAFAWRRTWVDDRPALYGVAGDGGMPVVFLHAWALGFRSYRRNRRVIKRAMPQPPSSVKRR